MRKIISFALLFLSLLLPVWAEEADPSATLPVEIHTVEDLTKKTEDDMLKVRNLGRKSLDEVIAKLESYGLSLSKQED